MMIAYHWSFKSLCFQLIQALKENPATSFEDSIMRERKSDIRDPSIVRGWWRTDFNHIKSQTSSRQWKEEETPRKQHWGSLRARFARAVFLLVPEINLFNYYKFLICWYWPSRLSSVFSFPDVVRQRFLKLPSLPIKIAPPPLEYLIK